MSDYADYVRERSNGDVLETGQGFAMYVFTDEQTCYIKEIYVKPEFRKRGVASDISDNIVKLAKQRGCTRLLGSVVPSIKGSTTSLRVLLAYGFELDSSANDFILFKKDLK